MLISKAIVFLILQHQPKNDFQSCGQAGNVHPLLPGMRRSAIYRTNGIGRDTQRQRDVAVRGVGRFVRLTACEGANNLFTFCRELTEFFLVNRAVAGTDAQQLHLKIAASAIPVRYSTTEFFFHLFQTILCGGTELIQHGGLLCNGVDRCAALDTPYIIGGAGTYRWLDLVQFIHESTQQLNGTGVAKICIGVTTGRFTGDLIPIRTHGTAAAKRHIKRERKAEQPPKLYDLTTLQREANRLFGFTAKQTLDYAQQLYEKKLLTYPRTDSQYLTEDMGQTAQHLVSDLLGLLPFAQGLALTAEVGRVLNSKKVSDHHAIIPTAEFVKQGFTGLAESECKLMNLACSKLLCAIAAPHEYETVTAVFFCAGNEFTAKGKTVLVPGWKEIDQRFHSTMKADGEEEAESLNTLPELAEGQSFRVTSTVSEHFTSPPKAYTEDTLLSAMERAGAEDMPEEAERKGLGTPATRAAILEKLVQMGFVQRKGKQLVPTKDGINLAVVLPESLTSPVLTAEWENRLTEIAKGNADPDEFMAEIEAQVRQLVKTYSCISADKQNLFQSERVIIGKCPRCSENVYEGKKNFYCGNRSCQFVMWKNDHFFEQRKKAFTPKIAAALLKDGKAKVKGLYSEKTGKIYDATVLLADTGGKYVNYRVERKE